ncbi:MAG: DEAD/DEAH box helicase [Spirochaetales bacterium]|nr:DEAD/DEAH box helicase [Spirochaetales bacterium]
MKNTPLIVQSDGSLLLDVHAEGFEEARADISPFAELEKSPEHIHTYRITSLSLWNASSAGITGEKVLHTLEEWSRYEVPDNISFLVKETMARFGVVTLVPGEKAGVFQLKVAEAAVRKELEHNRKLTAYLTPEGDGYTLPLIHRGTVKQLLLEAGYPADDRIPLTTGDPLSFSLREETLQGEAFSLRDYQEDAVRAFIGGGRPGTGYGVLVLPCGAGKTLVGMKVMEQLSTHTLILATNVTAVHQWIDELLSRTTLKEEEIGEYTGSKKEIRPVTIATYQVLTWRPDREGDFPHFKIFSERNWGLIIYDEVHLLPAPVFRITAEIQGIHRLGLTATLIREDGKEGDVFSLVGPKRFDVPWKELESKGWIAEAYCREIRVSLPEKLKIAYALADKRGKFRLASENPLKNLIAKHIIANRREDSILVIGQYLDQLKSIAQELKAPLITGSTPNARREEIYSQFRRGKVPVLVVSKVANYSIDLPDASVAIQISGTFGSRQEEAQRLGRILRPKEKNSWFYSLTTRFSEEEHYAMKRQQFLTEQGYKYHIDVWEDSEDLEEPAENRF